jgi:hypothetical protein
MTISMRHLTRLLLLGIAVGVILYLGYLAFGLLG